MSAKETLHDLVEALPESCEARAERLLRSLLLPLALAEAPDDDEPETDDEQRSVARGRADMIARRVTTDEERGRELGDPVED